MRELGGNMKRLKFVNDWIIGLVATLCFFVHVVPSYGQTTSGPLAGDEVWSGTITLTGDVTVPEGITLTIQSGTEVVFRALSDDQGGGNDAGRTELIVNGSLLAVGSEGSEIVFTSGAGSPAKGDWGGVYVSWDLGSQ